MNSLVLTLPRPLSLLVANSQHAGAERGLPYHFTQRECDLSVGQQLLIHTSAGPGDQDAHCLAGALGYPSVVKGSFCGAARVAVAVQVAGWWHVELNDCASCYPVKPDRAHRDLYGNHVLWVPSQREVRAVLGMLPPSWGRRAA